jgi:hypothetical protein
MTFPANQLIEDFYYSKTLEFIRLIFAVEKKGDFP